MAEDKMITLENLRRFKIDLDETIPSKTSDLTNDSGFITAAEIPAQVNADWNAVSGPAQILNKPNIPDLSDVPTKEQAVGSFVLTINDSTYVVTLQAKDVNGDNLGAPQTIDLPLESVVVNGRYDGTNKQIILVLNNGTEITVPVGDLVSGLQTEITTTNKLSANLVDDTNTTNKFITPAQATAITNAVPNTRTINGHTLVSDITLKTSDLTNDSGYITAADIPTIPTKTSDLTNDSGFITKGVSNLDNYTLSSDLANVATSGDYDDLTNKPTIPVVNDATLTIQKNGTTVGTFSANASQNVTVNIEADTQQQADWEQSDDTAPDFIKNKPTIPTVPTNVSAFNNDVGYITSAYHDATKQDAINDLADIRSGATAGSTAVQPADLATVATSGSYNDLSDQPTIPDVSGFATKTAAVGSFSLTINDSTYVVTLQAKDVNGTNLGQPQTIDLPLESVVVGGSYDADHKTIILTLNNGNTVTIPVDELVSGLQAEINVNNKLNADYVDDTFTNNKFVSSSDITTWNAKQDVISDLSTIRSGAEAGATAVQPADLATVATSGDYDDLLNKPTIPVVNNATLTIKNDGVTIGTFTANASQDVEVDIIGSGAQVQADWNEADSSAPDYIKNKPTIPVVPTNVSDFTNDAGYITSADIPTDVSDFNNDAGYITINDVPAQEQANWNETDTSAAGYIQNKPTIPVVPTNVSAFTNDANYITLNDVPPQVQADWNQTTTTAADFIKNKPTIPTVPTNVSAFNNDVGYITSAALPTNVSDLTNDAGYITSAALPTKTSDLTNDSDFITSADLPTDVSDLNNDAGYITSSDIPTELPNPNALTITEGSSTITYDGSAAASITIPVVTGLAQKTEAVGSLTLSIDSSTYVVTLQAKDVNGTNLGNAQTIDLPLESVVVNGSYDSATKKVILTLQSGSTIEFSVADLVSGLQTEITSANKLSADLVDDTNTTDKKFVTSAEKTAITNAVPNTRTVNGKALSSNITLGVSDIDSDIVVDANYEHITVSATDGVTAGSVTYKYELPNDVARTSDIPTKVSDLTNDSGFITTETKANWNEADSTSAAYIQNKPTNVSAFTNDAGYITSSDIPAQTQANWNESDTTSAAYIQNKPTIPTVPTDVSDFNNDAGYITISDVLQADWNESDTSSKAFIQNKPTIPAAQIQSDWNQADSSAKDFIKNKPTIPDAQVQADWNETSTTSKAYIQNKPTIPDAQVQANWNESDSTSKAYIQNKPTIPVVDYPVTDVTLDGSSVVSNKVAVLTTPDADDIDDTNTANKFVTATEKGYITTDKGRIDSILDGTTLGSFGDVETALVDKQNTITFVNLLPSDV